MVRRILSPGAYTLCKVAESLSKLMSEQHLRNASETNGGLQCFGILNDPSGFAMVLLAE